MVVYPHWRGELEPCQNGASFVPGLSPLARGTRTGARFSEAANRFIPAGAGNSVPPLSPVTEISVYPRWRGELGLPSGVIEYFGGLSPLARGTLQPGRLSGRLFRFIPAGAGNSRQRAGPCSSFTVYPRWRGELSKHNLLLINDFLSQSQSTNFTVSHKQHIHYVKEHLTH